MLKNYLTIAIRNLLRNKTYSFINIVGLSIGLTCVILISMYLAHEWSYDAFHENKDTIYRVVRREKNPAGEYSYFSSGAYPLGPTLVEEFPEITASMSYEYFSDQKVRVGDDFYSQTILYADANLFEFFTFPLIVRNPAAVLSTPGSVVITSDVAWKFFGEEAALDKRLTLEVFGTDQEFTVTGIAEPPPSNSTIQFDLVIRLADRITPGSWYSFFLQTYVQLELGTDPASLDTRLLALTREHYEPLIERRQSVEMSGMESYALSQDEDAMTHQLQPLREVYLRPPWIEGAAERGKPMYSFVLFGIAILILLIACINFTTLAIARSVSRTREVGIRKVVGAGRVSLMGQFWGEALIMVALSAVVAWLLAFYLLPLFSRLASLTADLNMTFGPGTVAAGFAILVLTSALAGSYPAVVLSSYQPVSVLYGKERGRNKNRFIKSLVGLQFVFSCFFICTTLIMAGQLHFLQTADTGFDRANILVLSNTGTSNIDLRGNEAEANQVLALLKTEIARAPGVLGVTAMASPATSGGAFKVVTSESGEKLSIAPFQIDSSFFSVLGLELKEGRLPRESTGGPSFEVVVNETLVEEFGLEPPIIGQVLGNVASEGNEPIIVGVVYDYHFRSLYNEIQPVILGTGISGVTVTMGQDLLVKVDGQRVDHTISEIRDIWEDILPNQPFLYSFLDEDLAALYGNEARWTSIVTSSSIAALLIACMGLFGLASLAATRRTKEIGIRKVVGASVAQLVSLLSKEFLILVLIANVIAWPVAWYAMRRWLENFAYRIDLSWWLFALAGLLALVIALATVSWQTVRAASANPVEALRYE